MTTNSISYPTRVVLSILIFLSPIMCFSQVNSLKLIESVDLASLNLNNQEQIQIQKLKSDRIVKYVHGLKIGNISKVIHSENGKIPIKLPGNNNAIVASPTDFDYFSDDNYRWCGEFKKEGGSLMIVCKGGKFAGRISINSKIYEIRSFTNNKQLLVEYDVANFVYDAPWPDPGPTPDTTFIPDPGHPSGLVGIEVLVLYTTAAKNFYSGDISTQSALALSILQTALANSLSTPNVNVYQV